MWYRTSANMRQSILCSESASGAVAYVCSDGSTVRGTVLEHTVQ